MHAGQGFSSLQHIAQLIYKKHAPTVKAVKNKCLNRSQNLHPIRQYLKENPLQCDFFPFPPHLLGSFLMVRPTPPPKRHQVALIRPSVFNRQMKIRLLRQNLKACKLTTFTVFTDGTSMILGGKTLTNTNPSFLELILEKMDGVSYWRQVGYYWNLVRLTVL